MQSESKILSMEIVVGRERSPCVTRFRIFPQWNQAQVISETVGHPPLLIGGTITIPELLGILRNLGKDEKK